MKFWLFLLIPFLALVAFAHENSGLTPLSSHLAREKILLDTRKPIAGNGDTASSIFLMQNLLQRGFQGSIDILVDEKSERILRSLSRNLVGVDENRVRILRIENLEARNYSLVIRTGMPSGRIFVENFRRTSAQERPRKGFVNVNAKTIFLAFTIYGNTYNKASLQPLSLSSQGDFFFLLPSTGFGVARSASGQAVVLTGDNSSLEFEEAGIFRDPFSLSIRNWSIEKIESFLQTESLKINPDLAELLRQVSSLRKSQTARYSLAYGFSIPQVKGQARDYFRGLLASKEPIVVLTPSAFGDSLLQSFTPEEQAQIRLTSLKEFAANGQTLPLNHLTVVQIPNVPHHIFSSLLLASQRNRLVPLGAGDGFFTTALSLGVPFAPTVVDWNIRNVRALGRILQIEALKAGLPFQQMQNLRRLYSAVPSDPVELAFSQNLLQYEELFGRAIFQVPDLTETIDRAVQHLRVAAEPPAGLFPIETADHLFAGQKPATSRPVGGAILCRDIR
jgi:hypothetical protein